MQIPFKDIENSEDTYWYRFMKNVCTDGILKQICENKNGEHEIILSYENCRNIVLRKVRPRQGYCYMLEQPFKVSVKTLDFELFKGLMDYRRENNFSIDNNYQQRGSFIPLDLIYVEDDNKKQINIIDGIEKANKNFEKWNLKQLESTLKIDYTMLNTVSIHDKQEIFYEELSFMKEEILKLKESQNEIKELLKNILEKIK